MMAKFNSENNPKGDTITGTVINIAYVYQSDNSHLSIMVNVIEGFLPDCQADNLIVLEDSYILCTYCIYFLITLSHIYCILQVETHMTYSLEI